MANNYIDLPVEDGGSSPPGVTSLNGETGVISIVAGTGISVTPVAQTIVVSATTEPTSIGTYDSQSKVADALVLLGNQLFAQSADATHPGMVNTGAQTFAGNKTFTGSIGASNLSGTNTGDVTIGTANGLSILAQALSLQLASGSQPGALSAADWTTFNSKQAAGSYITALTGDVIAAGPGSAASSIQANVVTNSKLAQMPTLTIKGNNAGVTADPLDLTVSQVKTMLNLTGTNSGDVTLTAVGASPNANAASLSGQALTLQPASSSFPGVVTTGTQTIAGAKTFSSALVGSASITGQSLAVSGTAGAGKLNLIAQTAAPSTPGSGTSLYSDASGRFSWKGTNGFTRTFDGTLNTADQVYVLPDVSGTVSVINPRKTSRLFDDFLSDGGTTSSAGTLGWDITKTGTGSAVLPGGYADVFNLAQGVAAPYTGTTTTGRTCISLSPNAVGFGYGSVTYETRLIIGTLSTLIDEFIVVFGFGDNFTGGSANTNDISFVYDRTTSVNWITRTTAAGIATTTTTSVPVSTSFNHLGINVNAAGTSVDFLVNDVVVATHTTNIPGFLQQVTPYFKILKSAGVNGRSFGIDYMLLNMNWSGTR